MGIIFGHPAKAATNVVGDLESAAVETAGEIKRSAQSSGNYKTAETVAGIEEWATGASELAYGVGEYPLVRGYNGIQDYYGYNKAGFSTGNSLYYAGLTNTPIAGSAFILFASFYSNQSLRGSSLGQPLNDKQRVRSGLFALGSLAGEFSMVRQFQMNMAPIGPSGVSVKANLSLSEFQQLSEEIRKSAAASAAEAKSFVEIVGPK